MIVRPQPGLVDILFHLRGSVVPRIWKRLAFMMMVSVIAVALMDHGMASGAHLAAAPFAVIGLALSIFMSFRNNACYDRWWEGRKQWGQLIISSRAFARQIATIDPAQREVLALGVIGFTKGLAAKLRGLDEEQAIAPFVPDLAPGTPNPTDAALRSVGIAAARLMREGAIEPMHYSVLETQLAALSGVQGACERIKATPLPYAFTLLLHRTAYGFCLLLPFALVSALGWWTPLPVLLVSYAFFGLDSLGDEMEDPFGTETNDLPLDAMARTVEREMLAMLGHTDLPPALLPQDDLLL
ncbi:bestrophin family protein [Novosphingobium sp. 9]|uniref:bestrophin family protein n=1 Tax=Novosphingobium sp. 9 TaxID=2025349 RepID=UPI0021B50172|nr:bestrophin family protein [Novosphingobium sp. 9]